MAHEVETMFFNSENGPPWHGLGTSVDGATDSENALIQAGLLWGVEKRPIVVDGKLVEGYAATVRTTDDRVLGIVTNRYTPVQNRQAFSWTDSLLGEGVRYETAGSLRGGKRVWLLARLKDPVELVGDETLTYLVFSNSHDGNGSVRCSLSAVRVVCANSLSWAMNGATRTWSAHHVGSIHEKLDLARETLGLTRRYMDALADEADKLANKQIDLQEYAERLLPLPPGLTDRAMETVKDLRSDILKRTQADDLKPFKGTAWALINAVSSHVGHAPPKRRTATFAERRFERIVDGDPLLQRARDLVVAST